jgi:FkbM family methyltransferase
LNKFNGTIANFSDFNRRFSFFIENEHDLIQRHHLNCELYENEELQIISSYTKGANIFFDIGANVGNHTAFFSQVLDAERIVCFEANPFTAEILKINILLNDISEIVNSSYLGIGIGDSFGNFQVTYPQKNNIGAARLLELSNEDISNNLETPVAVVPVIPLDSLNVLEIPDFIKIDVEGMELSVLKGMHHMINSYRPKLFIEVDNINLENFYEWVNINQYEIVDEFKRYKANQNFMLLPK